MHLESVLSYLIRDILDFPILALNLRAQDVLHGVDDGGRCFDEAQFVAFVERNGEEICGRRYVRAAEE